MLDNLIEKLEKIEYKLMKTKEEGSLAECFLPHESCRGLTNTVNILTSLVNRTTQNKNYEEDMAFCYDRSNNLYEESTFPKLSSSEEFLYEVKNVLMSKPESNSDILIYLSKFHQMLGDLVYSICEINNCKMKLLSGIKVKDLVKVKKLYSNSWELLTSLSQNSSYQHKPSRIQRKPCDEHTLEMNSILSDLVNTVELCFKEMSKVKLDIEHYIKYNMIEMQFDDPQETTDSKSNVNEDNNKRTGTVLYFESDNYDPNNQKDSDVSSQDFLDNGSKQFIPYNKPQNQSGSQENYITSCTYPKERGGWDKCYDYKFVQDRYGNFFNGPMLYPPEVLFFDPPTVVINSQVESTRKHSLPKIYSVDSMNDNDNMTSSSGHDSDPFNSRNETLKENFPEGCSDKKINIFRKMLFEDTDEDLFNEKINAERDEPEFIQLREKISSLFTLLKTNQINDNDDIFEGTLLKEEEEISPLTIFDKQEEEKIKKNCVKGKDLTKNVNSQLQNKNKEKQGTKNKITKNKNKKTFIQNQHKKQKHQSSSNQKSLLKQCPFNFWIPSEKEVIYDRHSVIELFKSDHRQFFNPESVPTEKSGFCLWPVAAEYIYVSKNAGSENCCSVPSGNSIFLGKTFEKSFYTLQMNKKYEQKQVYEGDIIVLDQMKTESIQNKRNSAYLLSTGNQVTGNYNEEKALENEDLKHLYPHNCAEKLNLRDNQIDSITNLLIPTEHRSIHAQKRTFAVHYADCAQSNFKKEKINFFNFDSYGDAQNWDSFISIMTSKVGPNTQINEQTMFRKIVKNFGVKKLPDNIRPNLVENNVHTLTSSGGPFRLFDINGYPLTDSEGNVLKDPYGKCLVDLDATGFPKDSVKVFDAAGNSPKDVKFDPTQKPQTNCVVVKLTDNFKRPLHLFDKYGRPLTDSSGKLLVNIHGRPLLRFDNFGRPNTDYRGGPLYTDNGFRWSFKAQSHSNEHPSNETLTSLKGNLQIESTNDISVFSDVTVEKSNTTGVNCSPDQTKLDVYTQADSKYSEIWHQVENVLQHHMNKSTREGRTSKTKMVVNSCTTNSIQEGEKNFNSNNYNYDGARKCAAVQVNHQKSGPKEQGENKGNERCNLFLDKACDTNIDFSNLNVGTSESDRPSEQGKKKGNDRSNYFLGKNINCDTKLDCLNVDTKTNENNWLAEPGEISGNDRFYHFLGRSTNCNTKLDYMNLNVKVNEPVVLYDNIKAKITNSKYLNDTKLQEKSFQTEYCRPGLFIEKNNFTKDSHLWGQEHVFGKKPLVDLSLYRQPGINNIIPPMFTFKTPEYLNNLCNQILKNQIESRVMLKEIHSKTPSLKHVFAGRRDYLPEATLSDFTSSYVSKYTNDVGLTVYSDSPVASQESSRDLKIIKILEDINSSFRKHNMPKNTTDERESLGDQVDVQVTLEKIKGKSFKKTKKWKDHRNTDNSGNILESSRTSRETNTYIDVANRMNQYQVDIKERMRSGYQAHMAETDSNTVTQEVIYPERDTNTVNYKTIIPEKQTAPQPINQITGVYHGEYCRHFKNAKDKNKDSPFRFPSEEKLVTTIAVNSNVDYVDGEKWLDKTERKYEGGTHKEFSMYAKHGVPHMAQFHPKLVKKQRPSRDCNLVSFLGTPVKYVLNKLDTKLSLRQEGKHKRHNHNHLHSIYEPTENDKNVKTLYAKGNKNYVTTETYPESKRGQKHGRKKEGLLAYKSKSFSGIPDSQEGNMSYSGTPDTSNKCTLESSSRSYKCSSDTVVVSRHKHNHQHRKSRKHEVKKPKKEQYSFETHYVHTSSTAKHHHHHDRRDKSPRGHHKHSSKSPKSKTKNTKLINKTGHSSKQRRVR